MSLLKQGIPPEDFYGKTSAAQDRIEAILRKQKSVVKYGVPKFMTRLLGPSRTWRVFKKQEDAIKCCLEQRNDLLCFAFEDVTGRRMFLAAHPKTFWAYNFHRFFKDCYSYEVIQEFSPCKLYLDIEYEYEYNKESNGEQMIKNIIHIINFNLNKVFQINVSLDDILDLNSSSKTKFSHHIIYEIPNVAFKNNYVVGNFIKSICAELREALESSLSGENYRLANIAEKYSLTKNDITGLFIHDNKNKKKIFLDEGVYTKNRHFRILGSSKQSKNIPLIISKNNRYKPNQSEESYECSLFLSSLVTYMTWKVSRVLEFGESEHYKKSTSMCVMKSEKSTNISECNIYPEIDSFINSLISPYGRIRKKTYFKHNSTIIYEIQGFRYCEKVKRCHKSNNIMYIVNLKCLGFYQKCYDPDCQNFRSNLKPLPDEIQFLYKENDSLINEFPEFSDESFVMIMEKFKKDYVFDESISDKDLNSVLDCTEEILSTNW